MSYPIDVTAGGAVILGPDCCCDGFLRDRKVRVQTHIHYDHMEGFDSSKGYQQIVLSAPSYDILIQDLNADLPYRSNVVGVSSGSEVEVNSTKVTLKSSGHMLGGVQVAVTLSEGSRVGYSSDFSWPLDDVINVDALVVDSTYGNPRSVRHYSQGACEDRFLELVKARLRLGPIDLIAHRGTLQRALQLLTGEIDCPIVCSERVADRVSVYRKHGYVIGSLTLHSALPEGDGGRCIRVYGTGDKRPVDSDGRTRIKLSAYCTRPDDPIAEISPTAYSVALSDHADFNGTLEYIAATGAQYVVTDNSRGGNAVHLAREVRERLSIPARPSSQRYTREWGR